MKKIASLTDLGLLNINFVFLVHLNETTLKPQCCKCHLETKRHIYLDKMTESFFKRLSDLVKFQDKSSLLLTCAEPNTNLSPQTEPTTTAIPPSESDSYLVVKSDKETIRVA